MKNLEDGENQLPSMNKDAVTLEVGGTQYLIPTEKSFFAVM